MVQPRHFQNGAATAGGHFEASCTVAFVPICTNCRTRNTRDLPECEKCGHLVRRCIFEEVEDVSLSDPPRLTVLENFVMKAGEFFSRVGRRL